MNVSMGGNQKTKPRKQWAGGTGIKNRGHNKLRENIVTKKTTKNGGKYTRRLKMKINMIE